MAPDIILLLLLSAISLSYIQCCGIYRFVVSGSQVLEGHAIKTISKTSVPLCWSECVWFSWCFSINVRQTSEEMFDCELNNSSKKANPNKMVSRKGWSYHEMGNIIGPNCKLHECKSKEDLGDGWLRYGDTSFKVFQEKKNWTAARSHCQSLGGDLLSITSSHENVFVHDVFVAQLNLTYIDKDLPKIGIRYDSWIWNGPEPSIQFQGTSGDVMYKAVDGETALYFTGGKGFARVPGTRVNPEGSTIAFWLKPYKYNLNTWIHYMRLLNQPSDDSSRVLDFFFQAGATTSMVDINTVDHIFKVFAYDVWNHIAFSWNKTAGLVHFVVNGTDSETKITPPPTITGSESLLLGTKRSDRAAIGETLKGYIKDIVLINKTMDSNQIQTFTFWNEHGAWIGLNDQANTAHLRWSDGTPVGQFMPFRHAQPNPTLSGRKCVVIGKDGKWLDKLCNLKYPFICEKKL